LRREWLGPEQKRRVPAFFGMIDVPGGQPSGQLWLFEEEEEEEEG